ncbi:hypothetical protein [Roseicella aerolata]|uniref:Uncharacterized protein n=1 Tax=Roseicella aerolata TaxID=2883479 RepID=A0A9X1IIL5_9PROT|nr:hypothetical protein [Roseicella aerolata]MCB4825319.1 hypothetical protein [Roseicella aerolata]
MSERKAVLLQRVYAARMPSTEAARLRAEAQTCREAAARMSLSTDRERLTRMAERLEATAHALETMLVHAEPADTE